MLLVHQQIERRNQPDEQLEYRLIDRAGDHHDAVEQRHDVFRELFKDFLPVQRDLRALERQELDIAQQLIHALGILVDERARQRDQRSDRCNHLRKENAQKRREQREHGQKCDRGADGAQELRPRAPPEQQLV